jgi:prevent-host-death family protein
MDDGGLPKETSGPGDRTGGPRELRVSMHQAKTQLSKLVRAAEAGDTVVILRGGQPVARLVPAEPKLRRRFGALNGLISIGPEFFEPLPDDELAAWEGS